MQKHSSERSRLPARKRAVLILCSLAIVGFFATVALIRPWKAEPVRAGSLETVSAPRAARQAAGESVPAEARSLTITHGQNPAVQKAGPPDPEAQRLAVSSAESAARAAADLAATSGK